MTAAKKALVTAALAALLIVPTASAGNTTVQPVALWIGDSYTLGAGVSQPWVYGESWRVSSALGWMPYIDAEGGTGFLNPGLTQYGYTAVPNRLAGYSTLNASVIVIDAGRNDWSAPWADEEATVTAYFKRLHKDFPKAAVVVITPWMMRSSRSDYLDLRCLEAEQARSYGWSYLDPIDQGWVDSTTAHLVGPDGAHPSETGYNYVDDKLTAEIPKALAAHGQQPIPGVCLEHGNRLPEPR